VADKEQHKNLMRQAICKHLIFLLILLAIKANITQLIILKGVSLLIMVATKIRSISFLYKSNQAYHRFRTPLHLGMLIILI